LPGGGRLQGQQAQDEDGVFAHGFAEEQRAIVGDPANGLKV
jgi:hypothetical protein